MKIFEQVLKYKPLSKASLSTYSPEMVREMLVSDFLSIADHEMEIMESYVKAYETEQAGKEKFKGAESGETQATPAETVATDEQGKPSEV